jgi:hypothetical protein
MLDVGPQERLGIESRVGDAVVAACYVELGDSAHVLDAVEQDGLVPDPGRAQTEDGVA